MATRVLGGGTIDGSLGTNPDWLSLVIPEGRVVQALSSQNTIEYYLVESTQAVGGHELSNGLYANPARLAVLAAVNTVNGDSGDVVLEADDINLKDSTKSIEERLMELEALASKGSPIQSVVSLLSSKTLIEDNGSTYLRSGQVSDDLLTYPDAEVSFTSLSEAAIQLKVGNEDPRGIIVNNGFLYVLEAIDDRLFKYTLDGTEVTSVATGSNPTGIFIVDNEIWVARSGSAVNYDLDLVRLSDTLNNSSVFNSSVIGFGVMGGNIYTMRTNGTVYYAPWPALNALNIVNQTDIFQNLTIGSSVGARGFHAYDGKFAISYYANTEQEYKASIVDSDSFSVNSDFIAQSGNQYTSIYVDGDKLYMSYYGSPRGYVRPHPAVVGSANELIDSSTGLPLYIKIK